MAESLDFELGRARLSVKRARSRRRARGRKRTGKMASRSNCPVLQDSASQQRVMEARQRQTSIVTWASSNDLLWQ